MASDLTRQIANEYTEGFSYLDTRKQRWVKQLVLMNNLKRGEENIASSSLPSFFNRVFSNLYDDKIQVKFRPPEDSDAKKTEALNRLAVNDYKEMEKELIDYDSVWDACFFSRGYVETGDFDLKRKILKPSVINPLMMVFDPFFSHPQSWRYYGKWRALGRHELIQLMRAGMLNIDSLDSLPTGVDERLWDFKVKRDQAKDTSPPPPQSSAEGTNSLFQVYHFYTYDDDGDKVWGWIDKSFTKIIRGPIKLDFRDAEDGKQSLWPVTMREIFREPHSSMSVSVPDLIEDKHRALNVLYNLLYMAAKDDANPVYAYDKNKVVDVTQLLSRQILEHIAIDGDPSGAIQPMATKPAMSPGILQFIGVMKNEAAEVIGTSQTNVPVKKGKQTATEAAIQTQIAELTSSLQSKILAFGDRDFWSHWYHRYMRYTKEGDEKMVAVTSVDGMTFEKINLGSAIKTKFPPKVEVLSSKEAQYKELVDRRDWQQQLPIIMKMLDPKGLRNFMTNIYLPKFEVPSSTADAMFPKTHDEILASQENGMIERDELPKVNEQDEDDEHIYVHYRAKNTSAKWAHIMAHEEARSKKKKLAEATAAQAPSPSDQATPGAPGGGSPPGKPGSGTKDLQRKPTSPEQAVAPAAQANKPAPKPPSA